MPPRAGGLRCNADIVSLVEFASLCKRKAGPPRWDAPFRIAASTINPERSTARRRNLERQLRGLGLADRYARLNAVDGRTLPGVPADRADVVGMRIGAATSYVVAPKSIDKVLFHLKAELTRGPRMAFDACLGALVEQGALEAVVVVSFLTGIDLDEGAISMIQKLDEEEHRLLLLRSAFFVGRDLEGDTPPKMAEIGARKAYSRLDEIREILAGTAVAGPD